MAKEVFFCQPSWYICTRGIKFISKRRYSIFSNDDGVICCFGRSNFIFTVKFSIFLFNASLNDYGMWLFVQKWMVSKIINPYLYDKQKLIFPVINGIHSDTFFAPSFTIRLKCLLDGVKG